MGVSGSECYARAIWRHKKGRQQTMEFGASIFFTDYSITPAALAVALEERGFDTLFAAEHSHIPVPRKTPPRKDRCAKR